MPPSCAGDEAGPTAARARRGLARAARLAAFACTIALAACPAARADLTSPPLKSAVPRVVARPQQPSRAPIRLRAGLRDWPGRLSHLAGTAHYDRGEWIYEDYPFTAYGAAPPATATAQEGIGALGTAVPQSGRLPGGLTEVQATSGAGPLVDEADLSTLRIAVRDTHLYVLAQTTTTKTPVRTALLLLFDTEHRSAQRSVGFGSGLKSNRADVAALVTASGTRIVDLASGRTTEAPAAADPRGYVNTLATRLPLEAVAPSGGSSVRLVAATGLVRPGSFTLQPGGAAGPIAKVVPRFNEPVQAVYERDQALALAHHDIDQFFTTVSLTELRRGDSQELLPGTGYSVRTLTAPRRLSTEGGTDGTLRDYGLYVPRCFTGKPLAATLLLRGSGMTAHSLAAITPALFTQLGDRNCAVVVSPGGRSAFDLWEGAAYLDADQALADAERLLPIDRNRVTVAGYSMGGFGTYLFAATQPYRFAAAFVIEGPVGGLQPATAGTIVNSFPNVIPSLANLYLTPIQIYQGEHDADVPITNALAAEQRLEGLGYRYRLNVFPGDHFTPGIFNDYSIGAHYLKNARRDAHPAEVRFTRDMAFEHAIDTGEHSDAPLARHSVGLRFDRAWFVRDLQATDRQAGTATVDVRSLAISEDQVAPVQTQGIDQGGDVGGEPPSVYDEQSWQPRPAAAKPRNALVATLTGTSHVTLDLTRMGLTVSKLLRGRIRTSDPVSVTLALPSRACVVSTDGARRVAGAHDVRRVTLSLGPGDHRFVVRPCRRRSVVPSVSSRRQ